MTDETLVGEALEGSEPAFAELVLRYRDRLLRFLLSRSASLADAEDAIQDTFVSAYRYLHSFDPRWRFSTWIFRIAIRNVASNGASEATVDEEVAGDSDPLAECIAASDRDNLWLTARRVLGTEAYDAMWLRFGEDLSVRDIARVLDRSESWVKVNLLRAKRRLSDALNGTEATASGSRHYG